MAEDRKRRVFREHLEDAVSDRGKVDHQAVRAGFLHALYVVKQVGDSAGHVHKISRADACLLVCCLCRSLEFLDTLLRAAVGRVAHELIVLDHIHAAACCLVKDPGGFCRTQPRAGLDHVQEQRTLFNAHVFPQSFNTVPRSTEICEVLLRKINVQELYLSGG